MSLFSSAGVGRVRPHAFSIRRFSSLVAGTPGCGGSCCRSPRRGRSSFRPSPGGAPSPTPCGVARMLTSFAAKRLRVFLPVLEEVRGDSRVVERGQPAGRLDLHRQREALPQAPSGTAGRRSRRLRRRELADGLDAGFVGLLDCCAGSSMARLTAAGSRKLTASLFASATSLRVVVLRDLGLRRGPALGSVHGLPGECDREAIRGPSRGSRRP